MLRVRRYMTMGTIVQLHLEGGFSLWKVFCCLPGAFASAQVYEGVHITVFWDRVEYPARAAPASVILAHVLVHEITHILQGVDRHSDGGVMKAHWTNQDFREMALKPLPFTPDDILLIHIGRE